MIFCLDLTPHANDEDARAVMILKTLQTSVAFKEVKY